MKHFLSLLLVFFSGCGNSAPDVAAVKKLLTSEQLAVSDPVANSVGMDLVPVPAGEFLMGTAIDLTPLEERLQKAIADPDVKAKMEKGEFSEDDLRKHLQRQVEEDRRKSDGPETPQHNVTITKPFFIGSCEVTQQQFEKVMGTKPWTGQPLVYESANYAATYISWEDAVAFCTKLGEQEDATYRLPTEAEWEYACRANTTTTRSFGDDGKQLGDYAWFDTNAYKDGAQYAHAVGQKLPNPWGLFDMYGNTWEWCQDWYGPYDKKAKDASDPTGPENGRTRVWRGGSFAEAAPNIRSASRGSWDRPDYRPEYLAGFRVVKEMGGAK